MEKIKIASLEFDYKNLIDAQAEIADKIRDTKEATAELIKEQDKLRDQGKAGTEQYKENARAVEENKVALNTLTQEYKNNSTIINSVAAQNAESVGTLDRLTARNKELRGHLRNLNLETEDGRKKQKEYIAEINKNTGFIKENSDEYVQQKMNIGNYKSALEGLPPSLQAGANGFKKASAAAKAFLANPLVLAITLIVGAVSALVKAFKNTEEGGDRVKRIFDQIKAAITVVTDRIENFALGLAKVFKGEAKLKDLKGTFAGIGDEMEREVRLAGQLRDMLEKLEDAEIDLIVTSSARRAEINKLREAAADQNKTESERAVLLQRASRLIDEETQSQKQLLLTKIANELGTTDIADAEARLNKIRLEGKQITLEELGLSNSTNVDRKRTNELIAEYIDLEGQASSQKKEMTSQISGLIKKELTERENLIAAENEALGKYYDAQIAAAEAEMLAEIEFEKQKFAEKERLRNEDLAKQKQWDEDLATFRQEKAFIDAENLRITRELALNDRYQAELDALKREQDAEIAAALRTGASVALITKKFAAIEMVIEREKQQAKLDIMGSFAGSLAQLFGEETRLGKAAAVTQTVINTYKGAMAAFAETPGGIIIKTAAAATAITAGVAAVRNILKAGGGGGGAPGMATDIPGTGSRGIEIGGAPQTSIAASVAQQQTVLVIEDFQRANDNVVKVREAAQL